MTHPAIEVHDLVRTYQTRRSAENPDAKPKIALNGVSLTVPQGELFGLLGPNGAGKTTLIKVLVTLLLPSSGTARVAGFDVAGEPSKVRERITMVSGGETSGYGLLTVREQLWMFSQFYGVPSKLAYERIDELLRILDLYPQRDERVSSLSTGMRQKMNLIRALVPEPEVLFLDEPTVGLDVSAARDIRAYICAWIQARPKRTILLTTHYLHEAEELCDRVAIIHQGQIIARDTPAALRRASHEGAEFVLTTAPLDGATWLVDVPGVRRSEIQERDGRSELRVHLDNDAAIAALVRALADRDREIFALEKIEPSLEDAFMELVGRRMSELDEPEGRP